MLNRLNNNQSMAIKANPHFTLPAICIPTEDRGNEIGVLLRDVFFIALSLI